MCWGLSSKPILVITATYFGLQKINLRFDFINSNILQIQKISKSEKNWEPDNYKWNTLPSRSKICRDQTLSVTATQIRF